MNTRASQAPVGSETTYPPRRPVRRKRRPPPWISLRRFPCETPGTSLRVSAFQTDSGRLRYIEPFACAHPPRVHDGAETPSTISLKQASTIAEIRKALHERWVALSPGLPNADDILVIGIDLTKSAGAA